MNDLFSNDSSIDFADADDFDIKTLNMTLPRTYSTLLSHESHRAIVMVSYRPHSDDFLSVKTRGMPT